MIERLRLEMVDLVENVKIHRGGAVENVIKDQLETGAEVSVKKIRFMKIWR